MMCCFCKKTSFKKMPGHRHPGSTGTIPWQVCLWGQHLCASPVAVTGRTGCGGMENAPSSQGCKPLQKVFSGRATIEKPSKENMTTNKSLKKGTAVKTPSPVSAHRPAKAGGADCAVSGYQWQLSCCRAKQSTALSGES